MYSQRVQRLFAILALLALAVLLGWLIGTVFVSGSLVLGLSLSLIVATHTLFVIRQPLRKALFALFLATLFIFPVARVNLSSTPIYLIDVALAIMWLNILLSKQPIRARFQNSRRLFALLLLFWIPSTTFSFFHEVYLTSNALETTYMLLRTLLSVGVAIVITLTINDLADYHRTLCFIAICLAVTSLIGLLTAVLSPENPLLTTIDSLTPTEISAKQEVYLSRTDVVRSGGLIGGPNHLGNMIVILWSMTFGLNLTMNSQRGRSLLMIALILGIVALLLTYTRSALLGFGLMLSWYFIRLQSGRVRLVGSLIFLVIILIGISSLFSVVEVDYLLGRFESLLGTGAGSTSDIYSNQARILAYVEIPEFLVEHPAWMVTGRGFATFDLWLRGLLPNAFLQSDIANTQNHSLIVMTFYQRGLIGALLLGALWLAAFAALQRISGGELSYLAISLQAGLIGLIPGWLFDHFFASTVHMQTAMFVIWGMTMSLLYIDENVSSGADSPCR